MSTGRKPNTRSSGIDRRNISNNANTNNNNNQNQTSNDQRPKKSSDNNNNNNKEATASETSQGSGGQTVLGIWRNAAGWPCQHNAWDNLRMRKGVMMLRCRTCSVSWKIFRPSPCESFFTNQKCVDGDACPNPHIFKTRHSCSRDESAEQYQHHHQSQQGEADDMEQAAPTVGVATTNSSSNASPTQQSLIPSPASTLRAIQRDLKILAPGSPSSAQLPFQHRQPPPSRAMPPVEHLSQPYGTAPYYQQHYHHHQQQPPATPPTNSPPQVPSQQGSPKYMHNPYSAEVLSPTTLLMHGTLAHTDSFSFTPNYGNSGHGGVTSGAPRHCEQCGAYSNLPGSACPRCGFLNMQLGPSVLNSAGPASPLTGSFNMNLGMPMSPNTLLGQPMSPIHNNGASHMQLDSSTSSIPSLTGSFRRGGSGRGGRGGSSSQSGSPDNRPLKHGSPRHNK